jgi:hypothetical protein
MLGRALICSLLGLACAVIILMRSPRALRIPLLVFNGFYVLTTAIGATILTLPGITDFWALLIPGMDARWLDPGENWGYWFLVWAPLLVTNLAAVVLFPRLRRPALVAARLLSTHVDVLPAAIVSGAMCTYCFLNLYYRGYLGVGLFSGDTVGLYRLNIEMRAQLFNELGAVHFAFIYMGIPALALVSFYNAVRERRFAWTALLLLLSAALCYLYAATLTKSNIMIFGLELVVAARVLNVIRLRGILVAVVAGSFVLMLLSTLLGGTNLFDVAFNGYNLLFREASNVPFYVAIFPQQIPFVGLDLGLGGFGFGPEVPTNMVVSNIMFPQDTWVQGAAAVAAHVVAYAQGGYPWSFVTMLLVGAWLAFSGQLRKCAHNAVVFSTFIGAVTTCYYMSQSDFIGAFNVAYGFKWWLISLLLLIGLQRFLELALRAPPVESDRLAVKGG